MIATGRRGVRLEFSSSGLASRLIAPAVAMQVDSYAVSLTPQKSGLDPISLSTDQTTVLIEQVPFGLWDIRVSASNADGIPIAEGYAGGVTVEVRETTNVATTSKDSLANGYYLLVGRLYERGQLVMGRMEAVRILTGHQTSGQWIFVAVSLSGLEPGHYQLDAAAFTTDGKRAGSAGAFFSVERPAAGSLLSWGRDFEDQVSGTPSGTGFIAVAAGDYHSAAIRR